MTICRSGSVCRPVPTEVPCDAHEETSSVGERWTGLGGSRGVAMVVDAHVHVGKMLESGVDASPELILDVAKRSGVDVVMCTSLIALRYDMAEGNRIVYEAMRRYPGRIYGYATVSSQRFGKTALQEIEKCVLSYGFRGVKIYSYPDVSISEPAGVEVFKLAAALGVPVLAHAAPCDCEAIAEAVPEAKIIMAHMGAGIPGKGDWNRGIMAAERFPNIYLDIAGSPIQAGSLEEAVERVGADRVIFGTDFPLLEPRVQMAKVLDADISEGDRQLILGGNIIRVAGLPLGGGES